MPRIQPTYCSWTGAIEAELLGEAMEILRAHRRAHGVDRHEAHRAPGAGWRTRRATPGPGPPAPGGPAGRDRRASPRRGAALPFRPSPQKQGCAGNAGAQQHPTRRAPSSPTDVQPRGHSHGACAGRQLAPGVGHAEPARGRRRPRPRPDISQERVGEVGHDATDRSPTIQCSVNLLGGASPPHRPNLPPGFGCAGTGRARVSLFQPHSTCSRCW